MGKLAKPHEGPEKGCPFCGDVDSIGPESGFFNGWAVTCDNCGAIGPSAASEEGAWEKWYARVEQITKPEGDLNA